MILTSFPLTEGYVAVLNNLNNLSFTLFYIMLFNIILLLLYYCLLFNIILYNITLYYFMFQIVLKIEVTMLLPSAVLNVISRNISTSTSANQIIRLSRLRVVDNSEIGKLAMSEGKPPRCIHVYNKIGVGYIGKTKQN